MNAGQLIHEIERIAGCTAQVSGVNKINGELFKPEEILNAITQGASK
jgi:pyruvate/2-oxoacid:ferredoxin oxidoreductase alpha subunit